MEVISPTTGLSLLSTIFLFSHTYLFSSSKWFEYRGRNLSSFSDSRYNPSGKSSHWNPLIVMSGKYARCDNYSGEMFFFFLPTKRTGRYFDSQFHCQRLSLRCQLMGTRQVIITSSEGIISMPSPNVLYGSIWPHPPLHHRVHPHSLFNTACSSRTSAVSRLLEFVFSPLWCRKVA